MDRRMSRVLFGTALATAIVLASLLATASAFAGTFFVDQSNALASDANPGTETLPWRTLWRAMSVVAGDTVYVKDGTYNATTESGGAPPGVYAPLNSGTPGAPIAFRAFPGVRPTLTRGNLSSVPGETNPAILIVDHSYITWDGFTLADRTNATVYRANGVILENLRINPGPTPDTSGQSNYVGIFLQQTDGAVVRNSIIRNVYYTNPDGSVFVHQNAAAITLFDAHNTHIYNNEFFNCNTGIYDKENGVGNLHEKNYIHDMYENAILFNGFTSSRCGTCPVQDNTVRQNVVVNALLGVSFAVSGSFVPVSNNKFYNNTWYNVQDGGGLFSPDPTTYVYNNIIVATRFHYYSGSLSDFSVSDFSDFRAPTNPQARFLVNGVEQSLAQRQSLGYDTHSLTLDPQFVGPLTGTPPVTGFRLQSTSPLIGAGRTDGVPTGLAVNMGAYLSDSDVIGPGVTPNVTPPNPPTNLQVR